MNHMTTSRKPRILLTGASSGIGLTTAEQLAAGGAEVIMVSRDPASGAAAREKVAALATAAEPIFLAADLSNQASIRALSTLLHERFDSIDVLINSAGTAYRRRELTVDGIELTFATNHLAPFRLTHLVFDLLSAAPAARIISTTSESHSKRLDFDNLQGERKYTFFSAYARSKLANILFTYELARRLAGSRITANCFTPGPTSTNFGRGAGGAMGLLSALVRLVGSGAESGARTAAYLATSPEMDKATSLYFFHGRAGRRKPVTYDPEVAARLWVISERLTHASPEITKEVLEVMQ